ncbi:hypothetical protein B296_00037704 [Ensete ventricosum]|uniref:Uncharacterized protein n=1 Tax=Ensete ventricosum TaxID=4639 RepID=A0A426ZHN7_ENSVE|nr:hypothetical protein B296_00037704 [Ensete ventricosum]
MLHAGNMRSAGVGAPIVTLMQVFLPSLDCSYKTRPPRWWVPGKVSLMIKLGLIERVKSGVPLEHRSFFSFLDGNGDGESAYLFEGLGVTFCTSISSTGQVSDSSFLWRSLLVHLMSLAAPTTILATSCVLFLLCCRVVPSGSYET